MRDMLREGANLIVAFAVAFVALGAFFALAIWGTLRYTEERWGVEGVEKLIGAGTSFGLAILVLVVVVVVWRLVDGSYKAGGKVATDSMLQTVDGIGVAVEFFTASQKAQAEAVKASRISTEVEAARAKAASTMELEDFKWQVEQRKLEARQQYQLEAEHRKMSTRQQAALEDRRRREEQEAEEERRIRQLPWNQAASAASDYEDEDADAIERAPRFRRMH